MREKHCTTCCRLLPVTMNYFHIKIKRTPKRRTVYWGSECIDCERGRSRDYKRRNREALNSYSRENHKTLRATDPKYVEDSKRRSAKWYEANKARVLSARKISRARLRSTPEGLAQDRERSKLLARSRLKIPKWRTHNTISSQIRLALRRYGATGGKSQRVEEIIGYSIKTLIAHLERQFLKGMSWENRSDWHIDHILPVSSFKIVNTDGTLNTEEIRSCWALNNLRPIWKKDNLSKNAKRLHLL